MPVVIVLFTTRIGAVILTEAGLSFLGLGVPPPAPTWGSINLKVEEGDFFALLGPNGAGKSTTIGIICSLIRKTSGTVSVFGKDLDNELEVVKSFIGLVPQEFNFNQFDRVVLIVVNQAGYYGINRPLAYQRAEMYL
jgi:ABC-2 type transport system ATP-binding protein